MAVVLLAAWLAFSMLSRTGANPFLLQVPATYFSVGQQFQPRLVSRAASATAPSDTVTLQLRDGRGHMVATESIELEAGAAGLAPPLSLPAGGTYELRAVGANQQLDLTVHALGEPPASYGGVVKFAALGMAPGVEDYLGQHGFAVQDFSAPDAAPLVVVADPRLDGANLAAQYAALWQRAADGGQVLLLEPPPPMVTPFWPWAAPLAPPPGACGQDAFVPPLTDSLVAGDGFSSLLQPPLTLDLRHQTQVDLYRVDGHEIFRPHGSPGFDGCHALFSYRYGQGWVTISTLPLLDHFQDVRARIYLMNLIKAMKRRRHSAPASPGLAWVTSHRLQALARAPQNPLATEAVLYRSAPEEGVEPPPVLVPAATDGDAATCAREIPAPVGANWTLNLRVVRPLSHLTLAVQPAAAAAGLALEASADGLHWMPMASPGTAPAGPLRDLRLTATAAIAHLQMCEFSAQ